MIKVNSLSGGKTSSFMAEKYPADFNVFALVTIEAEYCKPKDKSLINYISNKLNKDFIATVESDKTLFVVRDLEQKIGKNIDWVAGDTFEKVIEYKKALPNQMWRFCTTKMKLQPIFDFCQQNIKEVVDMRVGFRYDEKERAERNKTNTTFKTVVSKSKNGRNIWEEIYWRELSFPLVESRVSHLEVYNWSKKSGLIFPEDSNCVGCFHKPIQQLRKNWDDEPLKMQWFQDMEKLTNRTFKNGAKYENIKKLGLQKNFFFGTGSGCSSGFCTD